eukprot:TRINITY_DN57957_c0_g1_i2.p1 TRINITY_DN57957_c0_g1~~TRINITY_DN57957_c0_g1_i2.p1  ORF type:complete len:284 (+),score=29.11 TRINITY_DN57957_c0_g1_i2:252-1103(+)
MSSMGHTQRLPTILMTDMVDTTHEPILLGELDGTCKYVVKLKDEAKDNAEFLTNVEAKPVALRLAATLLPQEETSLLAQAHGFLSFNVSYQFCNHCGAAVAPVEGGVKKQCVKTECRKKVYPPVQPVMISLVVDPKTGNLLLGRAARYSKGMYSLLAGFIEVGESAEEAVVREVMEEAGVEVDNVTIVYSHVWPMPSQLMIGCYAEAKTTEINFDKTELEDCKWFPESTIAAAIQQQYKKQDEEKESEVPITVPQRLATAHQLMKMYTERTLFDHVPRNSGKL